MPKKNVKPLKLLVHSDLMDTPEVEELVRKGHEVYEMPEDIANYDLVVGKNCWRLVEELAAMPGVFDFMIKAARAVKFKRAGKDDET